MAKRTEGRRSMKKTCSRGHVFYKSSDCPVCPKCWPGFYKKQAQGDFPKIGAPALRALLNANIKSMAGLARHTEASIMDLHAMGPKAMGILRAEMKRRRLAFKPAAKKRIGIAAAKKKQHG